MISIHPRTLAAGAIVIAAAGFIYAGVIPSGPLALLVSILAGLGAVFVASQGTGSSPYAPLLPALKAMRQGRSVDAPEGVSHELGRVYDELSRVAELIGSAQRDREEAERLRLRASSDEAKLRELQAELEARANQPQFTESLREARRVLVEGIDALGEGAATQSELGQQASQYLNTMSIESEEGVMTGEDES